MTNGILFKYCPCDYDFVKFRLKEHSKQNGPRAAEAKLGWQKIEKNRL
jgi:hypothetical protein